MRRMALIAVSAVALLLAGCTTTNDVADDDLVPFSVSLSNQSFDIPEVRLVVAIDGTVVFDERLEVRGQHHVVGSTHSLTPGVHLVEVAAPDHGKLVRREVELSAPRYAFVSFWGPREDPRGLVWNESDEPFNIA